MLHIFVSALWFGKLGSEGAVRVSSASVPLPAGRRWPRTPCVEFIGSEHGKPPLQVLGQQRAGPGAVCPPVPSPHSR